MPFAHGAQGVEQKRDRRNPLLDSIVVFFFREAQALVRCGPVTIRDDYDVIVALVDIPFDNSPLLLVGGAQSCFIPTGMWPISRMAFIT